MIHIILGFDSKKTEQVKRELGIDLTDQIVEHHVQATGIRFRDQLEQRIAHFKPITLSDAADKNEFFDSARYRGVAGSLPGGYIHDDRVLFFLDEFVSLVGGEIVFVDEPPKTTFEKNLHKLYKRAVAKKTTEDK